MTRYYYKLLLFSFFLILSNKCYALNLGEIDLISKPNQAFLANIEILSYTQDEIDGLKIKLASNKEYQKFDIERHSLLEKILFSLESRGERGLYIQAHAAYLAKDFPQRFLLEVSWPGGHIIKQYDISPKNKHAVEFSEQDELLHQQFEAAIEAAIKDDKTSVLHANRQIQHLTNKHTTSLPHLEKIRKTPSGGIVYNSVSKGESISKIAGLMRSDSEISINQVMVALFHENPHAFEANNIHHLKLGVSLTIANEQSITRLSKKEASRLAKHYMQNPGSPSPLPDSSKRENSFSEENLTSLDEEKVVKHLEIVNDSEGLIPLEILKRIKAEELAKSETAIQIAKKRIQTLQAEIMFLKKRIAELEKNNDSQQSSSFMENANLQGDNKTLMGNSQTKQNENTLLVGSDLSLKEHNPPITQLFKEHKTTLLLGFTILVLAIILWAFRHSNWISNLTYQFFRMRTSLGMSFPKAF